LTFLKQAQNEMAEYGYLHRVPGVGAFKSRLELERLIEEDRRRGREVVDIIDRYPDRRYGKFVTEQKAFRDPLLYESRIHIFSRDFHLRQVEEDTTGKFTTREHLTIAFREHAILERYFPVTLGASAFVLPRSTLAKMEQGQDPDQVFVSRTGSHLITWTSEARLRIILLTVTVLLIAIDVLIGIRHRRRTKGTVE
jgi:hypothetical protein